LGAETIIAAIASTLAVGTTAATIIFYVGQFVILGAASTFAAKNAAKGSPELGSKTITSRGTIDPAKIIYGTALVAGTLAYRNAHGIRNRELWAVHVLAGHEVNSITDVYLDTKQIPNSIINGGAAAGGEVDSGDFGPVRNQTVCAIYKHYGTSTQTANSALVAASSDWTTSHRLRGYAYAVTNFVLWDRTATIWEAGDPRNVKFLVEGKKIYDPRLDSTQIIDSTTSPVTMGSGSHRVADPTTWEFSDCPPLCVTDYLMDSKFSPLAGGIDPDRIDWEAVAAAADVCDALVFIPPAASPQNTQKRFTCNGVIYGSDTPEANVAALLSSFNGEMVFTGGKYVINAGGYVAPSDSLSEDDIIGAVSVGSALDSDKRVNTMKALFTDPDKDYETTETAEIELYKDTRDNGDPLLESVELPLTANWYMAQRILLLRLQKMNQELTLTVPCNLKAARLVPGQRVNLTITERGWTPKIFKVLSWEFFDRGGSGIGVSLSLIEDDSTAYGDPDIADYNTLSSTGALTLADPTPIPGIETLPTGVRIGEGAWNIELVNNSTDGTPDSNDGEIYFTAGTFLLPDGATRTSAGESLFTPYEGSLVPPDQVAYIFWGASNPVSRFASSPEYDFGTLDDKGVFTAIYDRFAGQWYAVDNFNNEIAFTPATTDIIVARLIKTSATGGIDSITSFVTYVDNPEATVGATLGTDVYNEAGSVLSDIDVRNDQIVTSSLSALNFNPGFELPRRRNSGSSSGLGSLAPAGWFTFGTSGSPLLYEDENTRDVVQLRGPLGSVMSNSALRAETGTQYEFAALVRARTGTLTCNLRAREYNTDALPSGGRAIGSTSSNPEDEIVAQDASQVVASQASIGTSYTLVSGIYTPGASANWFSLSMDAASDTDDMLVEWAIVRDASTRNTGALADQDTVDYSTDVTGGTKPENNATVGAEAGVNFVTEYTAGTSILLASTASQSTTSATYVQLSDSFQLEGSGDVRLYYDAYSDADVTNPDDPIQIQFRQGATTLTTVNRYGIGVWVTGLFVDVTLVSTDPIDVYVRRQEVGTTGGVRNVEIGIGAMGNGEAIV